MAGVSGVTLEELLKEVGVAPATLAKRCSDDHLRSISLFLDWQTVAPHLGLSETDQEEIESSGKTDPGKRLKTLAKWKARFAFKATYRRLIEVLLTTGRADHAEEVCKLLKDDPLNQSFINGTEATNGAGSESELVSEPLDAALSQPAAIKRPRMEITKSEAVCGGGSELRLQVSLDTTKFQMSDQLHDHSKTNNDLANSPIQPQQVHYQSTAVQTSQIVTRDQGSQTEPQELQLDVKCQNVLEKPEKRDIQWDKTIVEWKKGSPTPCCVIEDVNIAVQENRIFLGPSSTGSLCIYNSTKDEWLPYEIECPCRKFQATVVCNTLVVVPNEARENNKNFHTFDLTQPTQNWSWGNSYSSIPTLVCDPKLASAGPYLIVTSKSSCAAFPFNPGFICILDLKSSEWHFSDNFHLPSWIMNVSATTTDGDSLYIASGGSIASCSLPALVNLLSTKGPVKPLLKWNRLPQLPAFLLQTDSIDMTTLYGYLVVVVVAPTTTMRTILLIFDPKNNSWKKSIIPVPYNSPAITAIATLHDGRLIAFSKDCPFIGTLAFDRS